MIWIVHCIDAPDAAASRLAHKAEHSANVKSQAHVGMITGGPLLAGDRKSAMGSLFLVEADEQAQVERFVATDPFSTRGIWGEVRINAFLPSPTPTYDVTPIGAVATTAGV